MSLRKIRGDENIFGLIKVARVQFFIFIFRYRAIKTILVPIASAGRRRLHRNGRFDYRRSRKGILDATLVNIPNRF